MIIEDLKDKRVLVTGSSSGIGQATAIEFAKQGAFVGVHFFQTQHGAETTLEEVRKYSTGAIFRADMRDKLQVEQMVHSFAKINGGIDVLVNNAGTLIARYSFEDAPVEYHDDIFATNCRSVFLATQAAIGYLKESCGYIINIGSVGAYTGGGGGSGIYAGAKAAVQAETVGMAKEFAEYRIRVNAVVPGLIETRFHERFSSEERKMAVAAQTPAGRNGRAQDVANAIVFLASEEAAGFINGAYIAVNGGLYMRT